jgi:hypothetical protein
MNERDKEMCKQAWVENDWDGHVDLTKFADLIRADEREACAQVCDFEWGTGAEKDAGIMFAAVIRARGNT